MLTDVTIKPLSGGKVERAVIILHGLGDSASGIIGLGESFRPALPDTEFLAPDAPYPCDFMPFGFQWFPGDNWTPSVVLQGVTKAAAPLNEYIDHVMQSRNLTADKIALVGFSQGTMMSLFVAPRRQQAFAGVLGYSGALIGGDELKNNRTSSPPIMLIHGTHDDVVPFAAMDYAVAGLRAVNMNVTAVPCPNLGHSIDDLGLRTGLTFLRSIFNVS